MLNPQLDQPPRLFEIDLIKAVCIGAVVLNHAQDGLHLGHPALARLLQEWPRFAVPLFLWVAGFLFHKSSVPTSTLLRRMARRIVVPYLVCSVFMLWFRATWLFEPRLTDVSPGHILLLVLTGRTLGIYYFVALITGLYLFSLWLRTWPARLIWVLWGVLGVRWLTSDVALLSLRGASSGLADVLTEMVVVGAFMYLSGWLLSLRYADWRPRLRRNSGWLFTLALLLEFSAMLLITQLDTGSPWYALLTCVHFFAMLMGLLSAGLRWPTNAPMIRVLSDWSYAIYLLHFPLLRAAQYGMVNEENASRLDILLVLWGMGMGGTVLLVLVLRRLLGRRSRLLIGA